MAVEKVPVELEGARAKVTLRLQPILGEGSEPHLAGVRSNPGAAQQVGFRRREPRQRFRLGTERFRCSVGDAGVPIPGLVAPEGSFRTLPK